MIDEQLKQLISTAFASVPYPGRGSIGEPHCCDECRDLIDCFKDCTWQSVPASVIDLKYDKLPLFCPQAFHYYLPAFLVRSIDAPGSLTWEFTFYSLTTRSDAWFVARTHMFSFQQVECVIAFLKFVEDQFEELDRWLATEKVMKKRMAYWKALLEPA